MNRNLVSSWFWRLVIPKSDVGIRLAFSEDLLTWRDSVEFHEASRHHIVRETHTRE